MFRPLNAFLVALSNYRSRAVFGKSLGKLVKGETFDNDGRRVGKTSGLTVWNVFNELLLQEKGQQQNETTDFTKSSANFLLEAHKALSGGLQVHLVSDRLIFLLHTSLNSFIRNLP